MSSEEFQALNDDELDQVVGGRKHGKKMGNILPQPPHILPHIDASRCNCCGKCFCVCYQNAIIDCVSGYRVDASRCNGCGSCMNICSAVSWW